MIIALRAADALDHIRAIGFVPADHVLAAHLGCSENQAKSARELLERRGLTQTIAQQENAA